MSTPSEKHPELVELSDFLTRQMREPVAPETGPPVESDSNLSDSPYAPKPVHERAAARLRVLANNDANPAASAYAPKRARLREAETSIGPEAKPGASALEPGHAAATPVSAAHADDAASANAPSLPPDVPSAGCSQAGRTHLEKDEPTKQPRVSESACSGGHAADSGAISAFPPARAHNDAVSKPPPPSEMQRRILADQELARMEASLRLLQRRQGAAVRLPRAPNLPLPGHPSIVAPDSMHRSAGDTGKVLEWFARPRSLEATRVPAPPAKPARYLRASLMIATACFAGAVTYCALTYYAFVPARSSQWAAITEMASTTRSPRARIDREHQSPIKSESPSRAERDGEKAASPSSSAPAEFTKIETPEPGTPSAASVISLRHSLASPESAGEETALSRPSSAVRALEPEEIDLLLEQGERFIAAGDIVSARLTFERAAKAENATAALALAAAFDPIMLSKLGVLGIDNDVEKARLWYQRAQSLGSAQAPARLRALAER
jgi:hypothetical protein